MQVLILHRNYSVVSNDDLQRYFVKELVERSVDISKINTVPLTYPNGRAPNAAYLKNWYITFTHDVREYFGDEEVLLLVADAVYFKYITGVKKTEPYRGIVQPLRPFKELGCATTPPKGFNAVLSPAIGSLNYNPSNINGINLANQTSADYFNGNYVVPGEGVIKYAKYPSTYADVADCLSMLKQHPMLAMDVETKGLKLLHKENTLLTMALAYNVNEGIAFAITEDIVPLLKDFFKEYFGKYILHNASFDIKHIIHSIYMNGIMGNTELMHQGLDVFRGKLHDTKIIAYLALNSCSGNELGLKSLAQTFAGNYALEDINDPTKIPLPKLLEYNLVDTLSTWFVFNTYHPKMVRDNQEELYNTLMLDSLMLIIEMELTGMPMSAKRIQEAKKELQALETKFSDNIKNNPIIVDFTNLLQHDAMEAKNATLKTIQHPIEKFRDIEFNPNSSPQLVKLLYQEMGLPIIDLTKTKQPATGRKTLKKLINHIPENLTNHRELIKNLIDLSGVTKILSAFIPAFEEAIDRDGSGIVWLHGNFNLGGTKSGRLSSNNPVV